MIRQIFFNLAMTEMERPQRAAARVCKRKLRQQLRNPRSKQQTLTPLVHIINQFDPITLEPIDKNAKTAFWAYADPDGISAYVHDAPMLLRFCVESKSEPRDPVTMRPFELEEIRRLERAAGVPAGHLSLRRSEIAAARDAIALVEPLRTEDNQVALLQALCETISDAFDEALKCSVDDMLSFVEYTVIDFGESIRQILPHLQLTQHVIEFIGEETERGLTRASPVSLERPHVAACAGIVADVAVDELRKYMTDELGL
jgi:hypothetical protein